MRAGIIEPKVCASGSTGDRDNRRFNGRCGSFLVFRSSGGCAEARFPGVFWSFEIKSLCFHGYSRFIAIQPVLTGASGTRGTVSACRVSGAFQVKPLKYLTLSQVEHPEREIQYKDIELMPQTTPCGHGMSLNWPSRRAVEASGKFPVLPVPPVTSVGKSGG